MEDCSDDVRRVFNICDEDGDGVITTAQLKGILCELGIENVDSIIDEFTSLGEGGEHGSVTYPQFLQGVERCRLGRSISSRYSLTMSDLVTTIKNDKGGVIDPLSYENSALKEKVVLLEAHAYEFEQKCKSLERELVKCNQQVTKLKTKNGALVADLENVKIDGIKDKETKSELRRIVKRLKAENKAQEEQLLTANERVVELTQRVSAASPRNSHNKELHAVRAEALRLQESLGDATAQVLKLRVVNEQLAAAHQQEQHAVRILEVKVARLNGELESKERMLLELGLFADRCVGKHSILSELEQSYTATAPVPHDPVSPDASSKRRSISPNEISEIEIMQLKEYIVVLEMRLQEEEQVRTFQEENARDWQKRYIELAQKLGDVQHMNIVPCSQADASASLEDQPSTTVDDLALHQDRSVDSKRLPEEVAKSRQIEAVCNELKQLVVHSCTALSERMEATEKIWQCQYSSFAERLNSEHAKLRSITGNPEAHLHTYEQLNAEVAALRAHLLTLQETKAPSTSPQSGTHAYDELLLKKDEDLQCLNIEKLEIERGLATTRRKNEDLRQSVTTLEYELQRTTEEILRLEELVATRDAELASLQLLATEQVTKDVTRDTKCTVDAVEAISHTDRLTDSGALSDTKHGVYLSREASTILSTLLSDPDPLMDKLEETARNLHRRLAILKRKQTAPLVVNNVNSTVSRKTNSAVNNTKNQLVATLLWLLLLLGVRGCLTWPWI